MAKRDYSDTGKLSQSDELFEDIFQLALTKGEKKKRAAKPVTQTVKKPPAAPNKSTAGPRTIPPAPPLRRGAAISRGREPEKKSPPPQEARPRRLKKKLITVLFIALLGATTAAVLLPRLNLPEFSHKAPSPSAVRKGMPPKPEQQKAVVESQTPSPQAPATASIPSSPSPEGSAVEKKAHTGFLPSVEMTREGDTATRGENKERGETKNEGEKARQAEATGEGETKKAVEPIKEAAATKEAATDSASQAKGLAVSQPLPATGEKTLTDGKRRTPAQTTEEPRQLGKGKAGRKSYPYAVYLGSFQRQDAVAKALAEYNRKGLSPYLVRMDLGDKGVWLRVFTGQFETQEQADAFIKTSRIPGAETKHTRYAVLVGAYSSKQEGEARVSALKGAGCHAYVISDGDVGTRVHAGAYYRMEDAEKELAWLASKGVKGRIVER